jgi:MFS family permease
VNRSAPSSSYKAGLLAAMYVCQALPMGYVFGCLPVILRREGALLQGIGLLFTLHLPWALKFVCAPAVDRPPFPRLGRRKSWIVPLQWVAALLLAAVAQTPPQTRFAAMYGLLLLLNVAMAVGDIAVDGYATDMLLPEERPWGSAIQAGARFAGLMLGGGLMLLLNDALGWGPLCLILAAVVLALSLPVALHREIAPVWEAHRNDAGEGVSAFLRRPEILRLLPVLIVPTLFAFASFQMRPPLLVDLGVSPAAMGSLLLTCAYPAGLAGTLLSGWLLHRAGPRAFLRLFCAWSILLAAATALLAARGGLPGHAVLPAWLAGLILSSDNVLVGMVQVWGFTLMMRACAGPRAGTGFAVLSSLFILFPLALAPLVGMFGDRFGFAALYAALGLLMTAGFLLVERLLRAPRRPGRASG